MRLDKIIPWGRSRREYELMFALEEADLHRRILGCGDGPASFNAEMTRAGFEVVSCDPLYAVSGEQVQERFEASLEPVMSQVHAHPEDYVWRFHRSPEELLATRRAVLNTFLADYATGLSEGRYVVGELPVLPFADEEFDLAICSHLLFLYSEALSLDFHLQSIRELCRLAGEVRIFPFTDLRCERSPHVEPVTQALREAGFQVEIVPVNYQLQRNGNQMLRIRVPPGRAH
jgi:hypothetical protein